MLILIFSKIIVFILSITEGFYSEEPEEDNLCALTVIVRNIEQQKGNVIGCLFGEKKDFLKQSNWCSEVSVGAMSNLYLKFENIPNGIYAVSIFHDINNNGKLDTNFVGIPSEKYAFSNNVKGKFGPPKFNQACIKVKSKDEVIIIDL